MWVFARCTNVVCEVLTRAGLAGVPVKVVFGAYVTDMVFEVFLRTGRTRVFRQMFSSAGSMS